MKYRRFTLLAQMWDFTKTHKKFALAPMLFFLALSGLLFVFIESTALAPLIYSIF